MYCNNVQNIFKWDVVELKIYIFVELYQRLTTILTKLIELYNKNLVYIKACAIYEKVLYL
jgi:hypothetical protein